jgi:hypothetical protein
MSKFKIELAVVALLVVIGLSCWWVVKTSPERKVKAQYKNLVRFANRQEVEIAIIKQAVVLKQLKTAIKKANAKPVPKGVQNLYKDPNS